MKRAISLAMTLMLTLGLLISLLCPAAAESAVFKMQDDFEGYADETDTLFILQWGAQRANKAVTLHIDSENPLSGTKSLRTDYDLSQKPGWATIIHYPDQEHYSDALPSNCDGIKFTVKASGPIRIRVGTAFNYNSDWHFIYADTTPREYTIRFEDMRHVDSDWDFASAEYFSNLDTVIFGEDQPQGFSNSGSVWYDDIYFFKGDAPTYCGSLDEIKPAPVTTTTTEAPSSETTTTGPDASTTVSGTEKTNASGQTTASGAAATSAQTDNGDRTEKSSALPIVLGVLGGMVLMAGIGAALWFLVLKKKGTKG